MNIQITPNKLAPYTSYWLAFMALISLFHPPVFGGLEVIIENNLKSYNRSYQLLSNTTKVTKNPVQLWLHIRKSQQSNTAKAIYTLLKHKKIDGLPIEEKAVQTVKAGPSNNQLRVFKSEDLANANQLKAYLKSHLPALQIVDLSDKYAKSNWIKQGHFELWLNENTIIPQ